MENLMKLRRSRVVLGGALLFILLLGSSQFWTITLLVVPEWKVIIRGTDGGSRANRAATQLWRHSTYEPASTMYEETLYSDESGIVRFPRRNKSISLLDWMVGQLTEAIDIFPQTSSGPYSYVFTDGALNSLTYRGVFPTESQIVVSD